MRAALAAALIALPAVAWAEDAKPIACIDIPAAVAIASNPGTVRLSVGFGISERAFIQLTVDPATKTWALKMIFEGGDECVLTSGRTDQ